MALGFSKLNIKWGILYIFADLPCVAELIKQAKMTGVMHEADHAYSIQSTWWLHWLATNVLFMASFISIRRILLPITCTWICRIFSWNPDCCILEFYPCLLSVSFLSAAGCHCFDFCEVTYEKQDFMSLTLTLLVSMRASSSLFIALTWNILGPFMETYKLVDNGKLPKFEALYFCQNTVILIETRKKNLVAKYSPANHKISAELKSCNSFRIYPHNGPVYRLPCTMTSMHCRQQN